MLLLLLQARGRVPGKTGVWVGERKIGAVGVRITHGISSHGVALNVNTDLTWYSHIIPCGTPDKEVTSIAKELGGSAGSGLGRKWMDRGVGKDGGGRESSSSSSGRGSGRNVDLFWSRSNGEEGFSTGRKGLASAADELCLKNAVGLLRVEDGRFAEAVDSDTSSDGCGGNGTATASGFPAVGSSSDFAGVQDQPKDGRLSGNVPEVSFDVVMGQLVDALVRKFRWRDCEEVGLSWLLEDVWPELEEEQRKGAGGSEKMEAFLESMRRNTSDRH